MHLWFAFHLHWSHNATCFFEWLYMDSCQLNIVVAYTSDVCGRIWFWGINLILCKLPILPFVLLNTCQHQENQLSFSYFTVINCYARLAANSLHLRPIRGNQSYKSNDPTGCCFMIKSFMTYEAEKSWCLVDGAVASWPNRERLWCQ